MYLGILSLEKKHLFLDLEVYMSRIDGDFSDSEKKIIDAHCLEMHIDNNNYEPEKTQDEVFKMIDDTLTKKEKRIFFLEIVATVLADDVYDDSEEQLLKKMKDLFEISETDVSETFSIINEMKLVYKRCASFVEMYKICDK